MGGDDTPGVRAYSDEQMLRAVAGAACAWRSRLVSAGREEIELDPRTRTAILVVDFDEIAALHDALNARIGTPIVGALRDDLSDWLDVAEMVEPDGEWSPLP